MSLAQRLLHRALPSASCIIATAPPAGGKIRDARSIRESWQHCGGCLEGTLLTHQYPQAGEAAILLSPSPTPSLSFAAPHTYLPNPPAPQSPFTVSLLLLTVPGMSRLAPRP
ncbi:hypothetical protein DR999_PMT12002 [Platysternon megacephalum]|uniref:Uncharacterized protein n=1 Tax=Platysternon megacephalum TaxID=55544 RepID=A0A4D9E575_9SAUR|nr:hypothetical protein DR999_PMT12002 [Platysternon megacephalum]